MAIYKGNYLSGRVGNTIHYERGGVQIVRSRSGRYKDRKTVKQLSARTKFKSAVHFYGGMSGLYIKPIWQEPTVGTTRCGLNLFVQKSLHAFGTGDEPLIVDYEKLHVSTGNLLLPSGMEFERVGSTGIRLTWSRVLLSDRERPTDELWGVLVYEDDPRWCWCMPHLNVARDDGGGVIHLPGRLPGRVHLYCFFKSRGRNVYSDDWHFSLPGITS